ncbi:YveK family protein [Motilibacter aurantiacus]|uniref:hypothetical protein n=1 Tax=Motilibacter aurantiacus TaxID=2714955 RepID=UPI00140CB87C|nr:hypothetical protein [Motilibacter aurantiacus]NHC45872.1 hypothetical protein [Motilibacter aurantiacus]
MDLWQLTVLVLRRWYVALPIAFLAVVAAALAGSRIQPEYATTAQVQVTPPNVTLVGGIGALAPDESGDEVQEVTINPFLSGGAQTMAQTMATVMGSERVRLELAAGGGTGGYTVKAVTRSPFLQVNVVADSAGRASRTTELFGQVLRRELVDLQQEAGSPEIQFFEVTDLAVGETPSAGKDGLRKVQAIVLGVGLALAVGCALAVEGAHRTRAQRLARRRALAGLGPEPEAPGAREDGDGEARSVVLPRRPHAGSRH